MLKKFLFWLWLIPLALLWPVIHLLGFLIRFGRLIEDPGEVLVFLPMGLVAGILFLLLWRLSKGHRKTGLIVGYLVAAPFAYLGGLLSGLVDKPVLGALLWGGLPLAAGMLIGWAAGRVVDKMQAG